MQGVVLLRVAAALLLSAALAWPVQAQGVLNGGFLGSYYANAGFSGPPSFQRRDVRIDFAWPAYGAGGSSSPDYATVGQQGLSVSWTGQIMPATTETYSLALAAAGGGVTLAIRPTGSSAWTSLISDPATGQRTDTASFALTAQKSYDLQIQYSAAAPGGAVQLSWSSPTVPAQVIDPATPIGLNIGYSGANDPDMIFANAIKSSYHFQTYSDHTDTTHPAAVDSNGWPEEDATVPIWTSLASPGGTYQLSFTGQSQVVDWLGAGAFQSGGTTYGAVLPSGVGFNAATNTTTVNWIVSAAANPKAVWFGFGATRRVPGGPGGSGVTNIALMRPQGLDGTTSHAPGEIFTTSFKALLSNVTAIRFMDYLATLSNQQVNWTDRVKPTDWSQFQPANGYGYQGKGGSWEYLVALANETGKDVWINIPVAASDAYVTDLANLLLYGSDGANPYTSPQANPAYPPLNSNLRVYVEYSNEIWNEYFFQHQQMRTISTNMAAETNSPIVYDGTTSTVIIYQRAIAERLKEISDLFRGVWSDAAMLDRIRPIDEFEYGDAGSYGQVGLNFLEAYYDNADGGSHVATPVPVNSYLWGAGAAWYSTVNNDGAASITGMYQSGMSMSTPQTTITDADIAHAFGLHVAGYEGGFYIGNNAGSTSATQQALQLSANYADAATGFEAQAINLFYHYGGDLPFVFNAVGGTYGVAGPLLYNQPTPKLEGIAAATASYPAAPLIGQAVPATLPASVAAFATSTTAAGGTLSAPGQYIDWTLNVATGGTMQIATDTATPSAQVIYVDGVPQGPGPWTGPLAKGLHGIRVEDVAAGGMSLNNLVVGAGS
jgi:PA14 domain